MDPAWPRLSVDFSLHLLNLALDCKPTSVQHQLLEARRWEIRRVYRRLSLQEFRKEKQRFATADGRILERVQILEVKLMLDETMGLEEIEDFVHSSSLPKEI
jgi:hypothetical protein